MTSPSPAPTSAVRPATHGCVRCGAPVALDVGLCERCNPLGLKDSAASQVHGTVFVALVGGIVALAIIARLAVTGIGPFPAAVAGLEAQGDALAVTLTVTNQGSSAGQTTCRVTDPADRNGLTGAIILSPRIEAGKTATFTSTVTELGSTPRDLKVECTSP